MYGISVNMTNQLMSGQDLNLVQDNGVTFEKKPFRPLADEYGTKFTRILQYFGHRNRTHLIEVVTI
ncbi:hypothetical protein DSUL_50401 [Desulfovibrionales bacterium]